MPDAQQARLKELVYEMAELDAKRGRITTGQARAKWWDWLNKKMRVAAYARIKPEDFPKAVAFLTAERGRLLRRVRRYDQEAYRSGRYRGIWAKTGELGWSEAVVYDHMERRHGKRSLKALTLKELEQFYQWVFRQKAEGGPP